MKSAWFVLVLGCTLSTGHRSSAPEDTGGVQDSVPPRGDSGHRLRMKTMLASSRAGEVEPIPDERLQIVAPTPRSLSAEVQHVEKQLDELKARILTLHPDITDVNLGTFGLKEDRLHGENP
jgi:hypothetical protein